MLGMRTVKDLMLRQVASCVKKERESEGRRREITVRRGKRVEDIDPHTHTDRQTGSSC